MRQYYCYLFVLGYLLFSCNNGTNNSELLEIPVDIDQNYSLPLSEIAEITAIELELTDESLINPQQMNIKRIILFDNNVIIAERKKILVFNTDGKFVRSIGSKGQGPGEYIDIRNLAMDKKNKRLFVNASPKIICYDLDGNFIRESSKIQQDGIIVDMNYINDELLIIVEHIGRKDTKGLFNHSTIYCLNDELQITDSCTLRDNYFENPGFYMHPYEDFLLNGNSTVYLYYSDIYFNMQNPVEMVLRDTLYRFKENHLVPELKLKFKNDGMDGNGNKFIQLFNIYRSSRYIFALYGNSLENNYYCFCYDTKTGKGYNMKDGYSDDTNQIEERVNIRPFNLNPEMFYYLHTHMKPDKLEEPNPTLYLGKLKK